MIFETFAFVISIIIYDFFGFTNEPIDFLTKFFLFKNIYYLIICVFIIIINFFLEYKKYLKKRNYYY